MKAIVYTKAGKKIVEKEMPKLQTEDDVIVKVLKTTICGTDLHILQGHLPVVEEGRTLGHEGIGIVVEKGKNVEKFNVGDKVIISCVTTCGKCDYCKKGLYAHCEDGGWILGHLIDGLQAEYARIPHADNSLYHMPEGVSDESAMLLSDIIPTAYEIGVVRGKVMPGKTVAIVGAGPVGLSALITSKLYSPKEIIIIDFDDNRLKVAKELGATYCVNPGKEDPVAAVMKITNGVGVDVALEVVGIEPTFNTCQNIIAVDGTVAVVGVHGTPVKFNLDKLWIRNIAVTTGLVSTNTLPMLLDLVSKKVLDPSPLLTHTIPFSKLMEAYDIFENAAKNNAIKVAISFEE